MADLTITIPLNKKTVPLLTRTLADLEQAGISVKDEIKQVEIADLDLEMIDKQAEIVKLQTIKGDKLKVGKSNG